MGLLPRGGLPPLLGFVTLAIFVTGFVTLGVFVTLFVTGISGVLVTGFAVIASAIWSSKRLRAAARLLPVALAKRSARSLSVGPRT